MTDMLALHPRIILTVGDDGVVVTPHDIPNTAPFFAPNEAKNGAQEIAAFLDRHPAAQMILLADTLAQDYRADSLPRLNPFDRAKLAQRRLKQNFPAARMTACLKGRKARGDVLLIGLHDGNPVFAWAEKLRARIPVIALLPVEGARLIPRLMREAANGWAMLVSRNRSGGYRQIVTHKGAFVFTRLTPLPPDGAKDESETIARDIKASLDYLTRHGLRDSKELSVLLLLPGDAHEAPALKALPLKSVASLEPHAAARLLNLPFAPESGDDAGDLFFAATVAAARHPALPLRLPETHRAWRTGTIRQWGMRAAVIALLLACGHMIWSAGGLANDLWQARHVAATLAKTRAEFAREHADAAPTTEPLGRLRQAIERRRLYRAPTPTPWHGLAELARGLDHAAKITEIDWSKPAAQMPEIFSVALRMARTSKHEDRAATVVTFEQEAQNIAKAMPDYALSITRTPYPDLPKDSVTAASVSDPVGEIALQRKVP
ncbi:MAG: hypothetical protein KGI97_05170 [Alphaproteobacteria bacterium]|nr:hypothetical protein [Alphaproteobacteria bacterium]